jgi:hypothetical protein
MILKSILITSQSIAFKVSVSHTSYLCTIILLYDYFIHIHKTILFILYLLIFLQFYHGSMVKNWYSQ